MAYDAKKIYYRFDDHLSRLVLDYEASRQISPESENLYYGLPTDPYDEGLFVEHNVKRGLRNADGSGVVAGLTRISDVHGYNKVDGKVVPDQGKLTLRGYSIEDLVNNAQAENRYGYEEVAYLLITGSLPNKEELDGFCERPGAFRHLSDEYVKEFPMTTVSSSIMNVLQRAVLLLYAFDAEPDVITPEHEIDVAISMLARLPALPPSRIWPRSPSFAAPRFTCRTPRPVSPPPRPSCRSCAAAWRSPAMRRCCSTLCSCCMPSTAAATTPPSLAACCRLRPPTRIPPTPRLSARSRARATAAPMPGRVYARGHPRACLQLGGRGRGRGLPGKILDKQAFDGTGLIYGMGHAVYTLSDPRAEVCRRYARSLAAKKDLGEEFALIERIERPAPQVMRDHGMTKPICANIDLYTGFIYKMLGVPETLLRRFSPSPAWPAGRHTAWKSSSARTVLFARPIVR